MLASAESFGQIEHDRALVELDDTVSGLAQFAPDMTESQRRLVAFAIVGEEIADGAVREPLRSEYCSGDGDMLRPRSATIIDSPTTRTFVTIEPRA